MRRRGGLGRGLDALIPSAAPGGADGEQDRSGTVLAMQERRWALANLPYREVPVDLIDPNPRQPRGVFDEEELAELTASIQAVGVLQPVVVRPMGERYQLIMGERRLRAAKAAGLATIPAVLRETADEHLLRDALLENIHRQDLNPLEEAAAYEQLLDDFGVTHDDLAARLGKSRPAISNALRLLRLPGSVQRRVAAGTLSAGHARAIASIPDPEQQERLADRIISEGLTVRQAEELARRAAIGDPVLRGEESARRARPKLQAPGITELAGRLSDRLDTRVKIDVGKRKGKVLIEFASLDDLQRICDAIGLDTGQLAAAAGARSAADPPGGLPDGPGAEPPAVGHGEPSTGWPAASA
jgi:ParB family transcriptional regulator, chromosome partitioning protein